MSPAVARMMGVPEYSVSPTVSVPLSRAPVSDTVRVNTRPATDADLVMNSNCIRSSNLVRLRIARHEKQKQHNRSYSNLL